MLVLVMFGFRCYLCLCDFSRLRLWIRCCEILLEIILCWVNWNSFLCLVLRLVLCSWWYFSFICCIFFGFMLGLLLFFFRCCWYSRFICEVVLLYSCMFLVFWFIISCWCMCLILVSVVLDDSWCVRFFFLCLFELVGSCRFFSSCGSVMLVLIRENRIIVVVRKIIRLCVGNVLLLGRNNGRVSMLVRVIVLCMLVIEVVIMMC